MAAGSGVGLQTPSRFITPSWALACDSQCGPLCWQHSKVDGSYSRCTMMMTAAARTKALLLLVLPLLLCRCFLQGTVQLLVDKEAAPDVYNMRPDDMISVGPFTGNGLDMRSSGVLGVFR